MATPVNIQANLQLNPSSINASAKQVQQALGRITGQASEFQKSLDASTARVFAFGATTAVINGVTQSFKALISTTITVQAKLIEINSILGAGANEFNKYRNAIFNVAKTTGQSFKTVADGAAELARQGLSATESAKRLEAALILTRISGLNSTQSVKALTAAMNGFTSAGLSAEQVVNKIVAVDTAFAVSAQDLADGFSRAGSTAEDAGVSFDQLLGLITAVEQRTARGGAVIGNAFKSIFTRLSRGSTIDELKALGVAIDASQNGVQKLQALSKALENISDPTKASAIKELAGGVFQINVVSATLKDLGNQASIFGQATEKSFGAANEATEKNAALNESLLAQINSLVVSVTSLGEKIGGLTFGPLLQNLVSLATTLSEGLDKALDPEKGSKFIQGLFKIIGGFIAGPGLILFTVAFAKIFKTVVKFAREGFKTVMEMGSATEKVKQIEGGIVSLLQKDVGLRKTLASTTATQAQKEQAVIAAIQRENALLTQQQTLVRNIAAMSAQKGVTGYSSTGGFRGRRGKRYSAGGGGIMEPDLETAMVNEARDAPRGASPFVTKFRGKPAVMNTSESKVNIGGREEILTAAQADALIPRFAKSSVKGRPIDTRNYAYLVPQVGVRKTLGTMVHNGRKFSTGSPIRGPRKNAIKGASDDTEANLEGTLTKNIINGASKWTEKLKPLGKVADYNSVRRGFDTTAGAKGGLKAAIGGAFEVAISRSLDYEAATRENGGDFDIRGGKNLHRVQNLFGIRQRIADFKVSQSDSNKRSFLSKIAKEKGYKKDGTRKAGIANVSKAELNTAAANKARLNVKNRYGNDKKFQQGTTIPLKKHRAEMEEAISIETERLKRDVYNNAHSGFTNKKDIASRKERGIYKRLSGRVGRRAGGSLSSSEFQNLKRYRFGSLIKSGKNILSKTKFDARDVGMSAAFAGQGIARDKISESMAMENAQKRLAAAIESSNKTPDDEELKTVVKTLEQEIKTLEDSSMGIKSYATQIGTGVALQAGVSNLGGVFSGTKNLIGGGVDKGRKIFNRSKSGITPAFKRQRKLPQTSYQGFGGNPGNAQKELAKQARRNSVIKSSRMNLMKGAGNLMKGAGGIGAGFAIDAARSPIRKSLQTEGGQDTNASVFTDMMLGGSSYAAAAPGPLKVPAFATGAAMSGVEMYDDAVNTRVEGEEAGFLADDRLRSIKSRGRINDEFGVNGRTLGTDGGGRNINKLATMATGKASNLAQELNDASKAMVKLGASTVEGMAAQDKYVSLLEKRQYLIDNADAVQKARDAVVEFNSELNILAQQDVVSKLQQGNSAKLVNAQDGKDFLSGMTGPNANNARRANKIEIINRKALDSGLEQNKLEGRRDALLGMKGPAQIASAGALGVDVSEANAGNIKSLITEHFKDPIAEAGKAFEANVKEGAKAMIMDRIAIQESIKTLQGDKRALTGGRDPNTGKMVQGSINSNRVDEIVAGASQVPVDAGRVRSIVSAMGDARNSGDTEKFQNAMANLKEELGGRLQGNEDKVLGQFGFNLDDPKNKAFFDEVGRDSVVKGGNEKDRDFIAGLDGSGSGEIAVEGINERIKKQQEQMDYVNDQLKLFGDSMGKKDLVDNLNSIAESARMTAEGVTSATEESANLISVAEEVRGVVKIANKIILDDKKRIEALNKDLTTAEKRITDAESKLASMGGEQ